MNCHFTVSITHNPSLFNTTLFLLVLLAVSTAVGGEFPTPAACARRGVEIFGAYGWFGRSSGICLGLLALVLPVVTFLGMISGPAAEVTHGVLVQCAACLLITELFLTSLRK